MKGEQIVDDRVWITKAHYPLIQPWILDFKSNKIIICVRNPLDVFTSFASLVNTMCHSEQPEFSYSKNFPVWWDWWVRFNADTHAKYFKTLLKECAESKVPIHIVRYEDLVTDAKKEMEAVMKFMLDLEDIADTNCMRRLGEMAVMGSESGKSYKLKSTTGKFNINAFLFTEDQIKYIKEVNADNLYFLGYTNHPT